MLVEGFANVRTINAANGSNGHDNLPNVVVVAVPSIAAKNAKRMLGSFTAIGVKSLPNHDRHHIRPPGLSWDYNEIIPTRLAALTRSVRRFFDLVGALNRLTVIVSHSSVFRQRTAHGNSPASRIDNYPDWSARSITFHDFVPCPSLALHWRSGGRRQWTGS